MTVKVSSCKNIIQTSKVIEFYAKRTQVKGLYITFPKRDEIKFIYKGDNKDAAIKTWKEFFKHDLESEGYEIKYKGDTVVIKEVIVI